MLKRRHHGNEFCDTCETRVLIWQFIADDMADDLCSMSYFPPDEHGEAVWIDDFESLHLYDRVCEALNDIQD